MLNKFLLKMAILSSIVAVNIIFQSNATEASTGYNTAANNPQQETTPPVQAPVAGTTQATPQPGTQMQTAIAAPTTTQSTQGAAVIPHGQVSTPVNLPPKKRMRRTVQNKMVRQNVVKGVAAQQPQIMQNTAIVQGVPGAISPTQTATAKSTIRPNPKLRKNLKRVKQNRSGNVITAQKAQVTTPVAQGAPASVSQNEGATQQVVPAAPVVATAVQPGAQAGLVQTPQENAVGGPAQVPQG